MVTTVQLSEKTKSELLTIKSKLEIQTGRKQTLEDAIQWLIENSKHPNVEERIGNSDEFFGSGKQFDISIDDVSSLRREKNARIADF